VRAEGRIFEYDDDGREVGVRRADRPTNRPRDLIKCLLVGRVYKAEPLLEDMSRTRGDRGNNRRLVSDEYRRCKVCSRDPIIDGSGKEGHGRQPTVRARIFLLQGFEYTNCKPR